MKTSAKTLCLAFTVLMTASACSDEGDTLNGPAPSSVTGAASGPISLYPGDLPPNGDDALLSGTLKLTDNCLFVDVPQSPALIPVFPTLEVEWKPTDEQVVADGETYVVGEEVNFGGGMVSEDGTPPDGYVVPNTCPKFGLFRVTSLG